MNSVEHVVWGVNTIGRPTKGGHCGLGATMIASVPPLDHLLEISMQRICFTLDVRPEFLTQYLATHEAVWPEMLDALGAAGWTNYSLFHDGQGMIVGYLECEDWELARAAIGETDVNARWQASMDPFFTGPSGQRVDEGLRVLTPYFHLA